MALTTVDFKVTFDLTQDPKVFTIEDTTDYAGQSVALADVTGILKITSPSGTVIYNNTTHATPDIDPNVSLFNSIPISLPLDTLGEILQGGYKVDYEVEDTSGVPFVVQDSLSFTYVYDSPTVDLTLTFSCAQPLLSSKDITSYVVDGVSPTTLVRDHSLFYPPATGEATLNGNNPLIQTNTVYTLKTEALQYTAKLVSTVTYDFKGHSVLDAPEITEYIDVLCDPNLCDIYCGLRAQYDRWQKSKGTLQGQKELETLLVLTGLANLAKQSIDCSKTEDLTMYLEEIQKIGEFSTDCQCDDGEPILITGLGGGGITVVSPGTNIAVGAVTVGDTTTYTVSVAQSFIDQVDALEGSKPVDGVQINVTDLGLTLGVRNYSVDISLGLSSGTMPVVDVTGEFLEDGILSWDGASLLGPLSPGDALAIGVDSYNLISGTGLGGLLSGTGTGVEKIVGGTNYFSGVVDDSGTKRVVMRLDDGADLLAEVDLSANRFSIKDGAKNSIIGDGSSLTLLSTDGTSSSLAINELSTTISTRDTLVDLSAAGFFRVEGNLLKVLDLHYGGEFALGQSARYGGVDSVTIGAGSDTSASTLANIAIGKDSLVTSSAANSAIAIGETAEVTTSGGGISIGKMAGKNTGSVGANAIVIGYQAAVGALGVGVNSISAGSLTENQSTAVKGVAMGYALSNVASGAIVLGHGVTGVSRMVTTQANSFNLGWNVTAPQVTIGVTSSFFNTGSNYMFGSVAAAPSMVSAEGDMEVVSSGQGFILKSPDLTRWRIEVSNAGTLSASAV